MNLHYLILMMLQRPVTETMEHEREKKVRFYIFIFMKLGEGGMKIHRKYASVHRTSCSYGTVCRWIRRFQSGKREVWVEPRSSARKTSRMNENTIEYRQKKQAIADDPHIPTEEISEYLTFHVVQFTDLYTKESVFFSLQPTG